MERRIGHRHHTGGIPAKWLPATRRRWRHVPDAVIVEFSVSGALIVAPPGTTPVVGQLVALRAEHGRATVRIARIIPSGDPTTPYCGVQFICLDDRFQQLVNQRTVTSDTFFTDWY